MYIVIAVLVFGLLIAVHELGHFLFAKAFKVRVNEFSIGMGPTLLKRQRGETLYSWRALPIGGFCAMEGEDGSSDSERSFQKKNFIQKFLILIAGSAMNFLTGLLIVLILYAGSTAYSTNRIVSFEPGFPLSGESGLMEGDEILSIDGHRIFYASNFLTYMSRASSDTVDVIVVRDGQRVKLDDFPLQLREYETENGPVTKYGVNFAITRATPLQTVRYSVYTALDFVRLVRNGLSDLIAGAVHIKDMSGPVGIVSAMNSVGESAATTADAFKDIAYLSAFIAVNLAVMNLLPIPALDGGRIFFLVVTWIIEKITHKKVDEKYENAINTIGFILLLGLMAYVMVNDILRLIR